MPRPDVSEERTTQIIEGAVKVFTELGIGKARMDDIAQKTGVSKGTIYLYFKSKDAIIRTILEAFLGRELAQARAVMDVPIAPADKLHQIARVMVDDLVKIKPLLSLYFELMALAMRRETVRDVITNSFTEFIEIIEMIIQQGIEAGEFRQVNVRDAGLAVGAVFEGTILLWAYNPKWVDFERHVDTSLELLLDGLRA